MIKGNTTQPLNKAFVRRCFKAKGGLTVSSFEQESFFLEADSLLKVPDGIIPSPTDHKKNVEKERTCCFTGHRAKKLPCYGDRNDPRIKALCSKIYFEIKELYEKHGVRYFLTGMANGADLLCAEEVIRLKREFPDILLLTWETSSCRVPGTCRISLCPS